MKKRRQATAALLLSGCIFLSGCGSMFDKEYVAETEVSLSPQSEREEEDRTIVKNRSELVAAIRSTVSAGETESRIQFDSAYDGTPADDLAAACWRIRTEDALCVYCVENISYELSQIVSFSEALMKVSYASAGVPVGQILRQSYTAGLSEMIETAITSGTNRLAVLVQRSTWSEEDMRNAFSEQYHENPGLAPAEPNAVVTMYSGTGTQRLYDIELNYPYSQREFLFRKSLIESLDPFGDIDVSQLSDAQKALLAADYLLSSCTIAGDAEENSIYSALIGESTGTDGAAFAYIELCKRLGLECRIIYGQKDWEDSCWNLVKADGDYYHVDLKACQDHGYEGTFLCSDTVFWGPYRWNVASYPQCNGPLQYMDAIAETEEEAES